MGDLNDWFLAIRRSKLSTIQRFSKNLENIDIVTSHSINEVEVRDLPSLMHSIKMSLD